MNGNIALLPMVNVDVKRGDIFYANLDEIEDAVGSEQTGQRPVMVLQNDIGNRNSPTTIVAILTTKKKKTLPTHIDIPEIEGLHRKSTVCLEQIKTIDKSRLNEYCGNVGDAYMREIEKAILISMGFTHEAVEKQSPAEDYNETDRSIIQIKKKTSFDQGHRDWINLATEQETFFTEIRQYMVNLEIAIRNMNVEIEEILSCIAATNFNVLQGYMAYRLIRERSKQRAEAVAELKQLKTMTSQFQCEQMRRIYQSAVMKMQRLAEEEKMINAKWIEELY